MNRVNRDEIMIGEFFDGSRILPGLKCSKHPRYKGLMNPRIDCEACREIYNIRQNESVKGKRFGK